MPEEVRPHLSCLRSTALASVGFLDSDILERAKGIEPLSEVWKTPVMPLYEARIRESRGSCNLTASG